MWQMDLSCAEKQPSLAQVWLFSRTILRNHSEYYENILSHRPVYGAVALWYISEAPGHPGFLKKTQIKNMYFSWRNIDSGFWKCSPKYGFTKRKMRFRWPVPRLCLKPPPSYCTYACVQLKRLELEDKPCRSVNRVIFYILLMNRSERFAAT